MMELRWTPEAIQDREAIYDYIEADNPTAALALDELFELSGAASGTLPAPASLHAPIRLGEHQT